MKKALKYFVGLVLLVVLAFKFRLFQKAGSHEGIVIKI